MGIGEGGPKGVSHSWSPAFLRKAMGTGDDGAEQGTIWEVIGGADKGGAGGTQLRVLVRVDEEVSSTPFPDRLTTGSLVMEVELVGDRLRYDRIAGTGAGPDSGWVSVRLGRRELLVPSPPVVCSH
eukprot:s5859_g1.t1